MDKIDLTDVLNTVRLLASSRAFFEIVPRVSQRVHDLIKKCSNESVPTIKYAYEDISRKY